MYTSVVCVMNLFLKKTHQIQPEKEGKLHNAYKHTNCSSNLDILIYLAVWGICHKHNAFEFDFFKIGNYPSYLCK